MGSVPAASIARVSAAFQAINQSASPEYAGSRRRDTNPQYWTTNLCMNEIKFQHRQVQSIMLRASSLQSAL